MRGPPSLADGQHYFFSRAPNCTNRRQHHHRKTACGRTRCASCVSCRTDSPFQDGRVGADKEGLFDVYGLLQHVPTGHGEQRYVEVLPLKGPQQPEQAARCCRVVAERTEERQTGKTGKIEMRK